MNKLMCCLLLLATALVGNSGRSADPSAPKGSVDVPSVVKGNNEFALSLYAQLSQKEGNVFFAPWGISSALSLVYGGARGETAEQMAATLHLLDPTRQHPSFAELIRSLNGHGLARDYQLFAANSLWHQQGEDFLDDYLKLARDHYGARPHPIDFHKDRGAARLAINRWVEERTNRKITDLLKPDTLQPDTVLVLTSAIYFRAAWQSKFESKQTRNAEFLAAKGKKVPVAMMSQTGKFAYLDGRTFQAIELPYEGKELSLVVVLPRQADGLAELEKSLTAARLDKLLEGLKEREVALALPHFRIGSDFSLKKELSAMGMPLAFSRADFSGMNGKQNLALGDVLHQSFVDVGEEGTEAAAATAGTIVKRSAVDDKVVSFGADHPFLFLIRDRQTGCILFLGRLMDPSSQAKGSAKDR